MSSTRTTSAAAIAAGPSAREATRTPAQASASREAWRVEAASSSGPPPFTTTPSRASDVTAATTVTGVEITSAHGHASTRNTSAR